MIDKIIFSEFFLSKNKSIETKGFSGHEYSKDKKKPIYLSLQQAV